MLRFKNRLTLLLLISLSGMSHQLFPVNINETLSAALNFSPGLKAAHQGLLLEKEAVSKARSEFYPEIDYLHVYGRQRNELDGTRTISPVGNGAVNIDQPIFEGFSNIAGYRRSRLKEMAARHEFKSELQEILFLAAVAHIQLARDEVILGLSKKNEEAHEKQLEATQLRQQYGELTQTDVYQAAARLANAQAFSLESEKELAVSHAEYFEIVGRKPKDSAEMPTAFSFIPESREQSIKYAVDSNPELKASEYAESASAKAIDEVKGKLWPRVFTRGRYEWDQHSGSFRSSDLENYSVTLNLEFPIFNMGNYSDVRKSRIEYRKARYERDAIFQRVQREAVTGWEQFNISTDIIAKRLTAVEEADKTLSGYREEYAAGNRTTVNVLDAEQDYFESKISLTLAQSEHAVHAYQLMSAIGRLQNLAELSANMQRDFDRNFPLDK